ncbi:MAG: MarR family transcriptional regulator [Phycisphaerales bacterium]|nr:MAG: MarR family transcriptional regulator [Phycisphaerales bacterium]
MKQAGHVRTRDDHASEVDEDYVEAIAEIATRLGACRVRDLQERFGVSHVTVTRRVQRLVDQKLATQEPRGPVALTTKGRKLASMSLERHEAVVAFLRSIGVDARTAEIDAEGIEHHVSKVTLDRMRAETRRRNGA